MMATIIIGEMTTGAYAYGYCPAPIDYCYRDCPPPRGFRVRSCCDRWGPGTYLVPIYKPPRSLGTVSQRSRGSLRPVRELQIKSWI